MDLSFIINEGRLKNSWPTVEIGFDNLRGLLLTTGSLERYGKTTDYFKPFERILCKFEVLCSPFYRDGKSVESLAEVGHDFFNRPSPRQQWRGPPPPKTAQGRLVIGPLVDF